MIRMKQLAGGASPAPRPASGPVAWHTERCKWFREKAGWDHPYEPVCSRSAPDSSPAPNGSAHSSTVSYPLSASARSAPCPPIHELFDPQQRNDIPPLSLPCAGSFASHCGEFHESLWSELDSTQTQSKMDCAQLATPPRSLPAPSHPDAGTLSPYATFSLFRSCCTWSLNPPTLFRGRETNNVTAFERFCCASLKGLRGLTGMAFKFKGVDFIQFDGLLSEDELLTRDTTRQFVEDNIIPIIEQCNRDGRFPRELVGPMGQLGFFGASLEGYGCAGMSNVEYGLVMQELERGDSGLRSFVSVQSALVMYPIYTFGSDAQKDTWLPRLASGEKLGCFGLTEPDFGSNPGGMRTRARL